MYTTTNSILANLKTTSVNLKHLTYKIKLDLLANVVVCNTSRHYGMNKPVFQFTVKMKTILPYLPYSFLINVYCRSLPRTATPVTKISELYI